MDDLDDDRFSPLTESELVRGSGCGGAPPHNGWKAIVPIPDGVRLPDLLVKKCCPSGYSIRSAWRYRTPTGGVSGFVVRYDEPGTDGKEFKPFTYCESAAGKREWRCRGMPEPRPLFNLDLLAAKPDAPVLVSEGEKSAARAARIFPESVCITSPAGCKAWKQADWSPLAGRKVLIWPDCDEPGEEYSREVAHIIHGLGCSVSVVDAVALASLAPNGGQREPEKGWDAADAVAEWENLGALRKAAYGLAKPFEPGAPGFFDGNWEAKPFWTMSLLPASGIKPEPISWLWRDWLARGKMHIIAGQPGTGKTTLAMKMAATVSAGSRWPDGTEATKDNVIIWSGEDDPADTLVPRLEASGADLNRIFFAGEMSCGKERRDFDPAKDITALQAAIETAGGASLIIVDPIVSATAADSHKNSETRRGLQPLVDMTAKLDAALLGITHFTKGSEGRSPIDRVTGSVAFGALARVVMVATREQDGGDGKPGQRVLMRAKSNIGRDDGGFKYDLQLVPMREYPEIIVPVVSWGASVSGTARENSCRDRGHGWQWRGHGAPGSRGFSARFPNGRAETR